MPFEYIGVPPWAHQKECVERAARLPGFALFHEPGCGKTRTTVDILRCKFAQNNTLLRTLILCPPIVIQNWKQEILKYSRIPEDKIFTLEGSFFLRIAPTDIHRDGIFITNYQSLLMPKLLKRFLEMDFQVIVADESHLCKTHNSKTTKALLKLGAQSSVKYRYILTGTPVLNSAQDIFPQFLFLDGGKTFGTSFTAFRQRYYVDKNEGMPAHVYFPKWEMKPDTPQKIRELIAPISSTVFKQEVLSLCPMIRERVEVPLTEEQANLYKHLEENMVAELPNGSSVMSSLVVTNILRLQQLITGYVTNEEQTNVHFEKNPRAEALRSLLEQIGHLHKVIVWAVFKPNYETIRQAVHSAGLVCREIHGGMPSQKKWQAVEDFNRDKRVQVLIGHPQSAGIGINLVEANYSIFYSRSFSLGNDVQAEARNYRAGSERHSKVTRIDLVTPGTIDEVILNALSSKQNLSNAILKHYRKGPYGNQTA